MTQKRILIFYKMYSPRSELSSLTKASTLFDSLFMVLLNRIRCLLVSRIKMCIYEKMQND